MRELGADEAVLWKHPRSDRPRDLVLSQHRRHTKTESWKLTLDRNKGLESE